jgi:hypothetical protein
VDPRGSPHKPRKERRGKRGLPGVKGYAGKAHSPTAELNQDLIQREAATTAVTTATFATLRKYLRQKEEGEKERGEEEDGEMLIQVKPHLSEIYHLKSKS